MKEKEAHQLIADEILNLNFELITLAGKVFPVYPPSVRTFARMISVIDRLEFKDDNEAVKTIAENNFKVAKYLTYAVLGEKYSRFYGKMLFWLTYRKIIKSTASELKKALEIAQKSLGLEDFFACAGLTMATTIPAAKPKETTP